LADAVSSTSQEHISLLKAEQQHKDYVECLKQILPVRELPALTDHPDCCFVEDTVVVIGKKALLMRMGHDSRRMEVNYMANVLQSIPGLKVKDMRNMSETATCDGGDVLWTGRHVFVGQSERTNKEGVGVLQTFFSDWEVIAVPVSGALHLKSLVTNMDRYTLVAPTGELGNDLLEDMQASARGYEVVRLPSMLACNVVTVNGTVLAQDVDCQESKWQLQEAADEANLRLEFVNTSELAKVDGALSCCSVLLDL
jgi:dimethylargininase